MGNKGSKALLTIHPHSNFLNIIFPGKYGKVLEIFVEEI
jgi:hypothetical protein